MFADLPHSPGRTPSLTEPSSLLIHTCTQAAEGQCWVISLEIYVDKTLRPCTVLPWLTYCLGLWADYYFPPLEATQGPTLPGLGPSSQPHLTWSPGSARVSHSSLEHPPIGCWDTHVPMPSHLTALPSISSRPQSWGVPGLSLSLLFFSSHFQVRVSQHDWHSGPRSFFDVGAGQGTAGFLTAPPFSTRGPVAFFSTWTAAISIVYPDIVKCPLEENLSWLRTTAIDELSSPVASNAT